MRIRGVRIDPDIADKIDAKHSVLQEEVYEVFENDEDRPLIVRSDRVPGSYLVLGRTLAGRYLMIAFRLERGGVANVRTAREMKRHERRRY